MIYDGHVRAAFEDVYDINIVPREAHCLDDFCKELAGASDKRLALEVFIGTGSLADEHQVRVGISDAEDDRAPDLTRCGTGAANLFCRVGGLVPWRRRALPRRGGDPRAEGCEDGG